MNYCLTSIHAQIWVVNFPLCDILEYVGVVRQEPFGFKALL